MSKLLNWNAEKNIILINERKISFEQVAEKIISGDIIDDIYHPNSEKYFNQRIFVIEIESYIYLVPYIENEEGIFLKTIYPSRKFTKIYLGV
ncbi:MAG: toxin [bacterium]